MTNLQEGIQLQAGLFVEGVRVLIEQAVVEAIANAAAPSNRRGRGNGGLFATPLAGAIPTLFGLIKAFSPALAPVSGTRARSESCLG